MKGINKLLFKSPQKIIFTLVLTSILSLSVSVGLTVIQSATATPIKLAQNAGSQENARSDRLPSSVANAVIKDLSSREGIPVSKLKITEYSRQTWSDGCLGLGKLDQLCLQALVEGWRVVVSDNRQEWVYRTNSNGSNIGLENENNSAKLPSSVANAVLKDAASRSKFPSRLRIVQAEQQTWSDGCLGLAPPGVFCTAIALSGWLVAVADGQQILVYRTDQTSRFQLDRAASTIPVPIPQSQLPQPLQPGVIFRSISSGGFAGLTIETNLYEDGRLVQVEVNRFGNTSQTKTSRISQQKLQQFEKLLFQQKFANFNGLDYPPPSDAADYSIVTLTSPNGTTRYSDIAQNRLPSRLQAVVLAWNQLLY